LRGCGCAGFEARAVHRNGQLQGGQREPEANGGAHSGKGNIAVISIPGQRNLDDRVAGVADALKNFPALKLTKILDDKGDARSAFDQVSELIQKKEKVNGIICLEATGGSGAAEALHRFNMEGKLPIVAFDNDPETLDWIDRGVITATITQKPYVMSYYGLKFLDDLHHNAVHQFKDWRTPWLRRCRRSWIPHSARGQEQSQDLSRGSGRAPQAALEITYPVRIVVDTPGSSGVGCRGTTSR